MTDGLRVLRRSGGPVLVVLLHGFQDKPARMLEFADTLDPQGRSSFVAPRGPIETRDGPAWFVDHAGDGDVAGITDVTDRPSVVQSIELIDELVQEESHRVGAESSDAVIVGYSQGAAIALALAFRQGAQVRPQAVVAISGFLPHADGLEWAFDEAVGITDVLLVHGSHDAIVSPQQGRSAARVLGRHGVAVALREVDTGHELGREQIEPTAAWLADRVGGTNHLSRP